MSSAIEPDGPDGLESPRPVRPRRRRWVGLASFLGGVVVGVLLVGLLNVTTPTFLTEQPGGAASGPGEQSNPGGVPVTAEARVNAACLRVINGAQDVSTILTGVDEAVTDVDLQQLDDIVRQLQPVEVRLREDLLACRVDTSVDAGPDGGGSMSPAVPQPSPSATR